MIKDLIDKTYNQKPLQEISLHDLKYTPAIDKQEQAVIILMIYSYLLYILLYHKTQCLQNFLKILVRKRKTLHHFDKNR